eukprot:14073133-Alexandrium_andersonii.AAC.1
MAPMQSGAGIREKKIEGNFNGAMTDPLLLGGVLLVAPSGEVAPPFDDVHVATVVFAMETNLGSGAMLPAAGKCKGGFSPVQSA